MEDPRAIRARGLTKIYGDVVALDGIDLDVPAGQIHGLVGPNGAGKTTLLGLLLGLARPDGGALEVLGSPAGTALTDVAGFVEAPGLYPTLTARQNLAALASLRRVERPARLVREVLEQVELDDVADDRVGGFSLGMRQRLGLAGALLSRPRLLVLDEPANGLDPSSRNRVHRILTELATDGGTVVVSSHRMDDLVALCPDVTILDTGRVVFSGPMGKLVAEGGDLDYRLVTTDPGATRRLAAEELALTVVADVGPQPDVVVVRGPVEALDALVARVGAAGIALRELAPVITPLEAAFLALTSDDGESR